MIEQWARKRPDLDSSSLEVLQRISRLARVAEERADKVLSAFGLSDVEFHLLAAIRTSPGGPPSPRDLLGPLMVTSGGLTGRIDRLEKTGLVGRVANPDDRRGVLLQLSEQGRQVIDRVTTEYLANQNRLLNDALGEADRETLARLLRQLLASLAEPDGRGGTAPPDVDQSGPPDVTGH